MKLLLTSAGLYNKSIVKAFNDLVNLPKEKIHIAYIPTAANVEEGDKGWLIDDYINLKREGYGCIDIVDISSIEKNVWLPRIKKANVIFVGGGNTFHLMHWFDKSGLSDILPELLKTRVYAGVSAGSCIAGPTILNPVQNLFEEKYDLKIKMGMGLVSLQIIPHLNSDYFPKIREENLEEASKDLKEPVYAIDDNSAVVVNDGDIIVVSEGKWRKFN
ncbi:MAG: Type 1 glutamine amidotransferase-like domain-containing protein [Candidatus Woesebacteria bacterium]|nr:Type 1 glutamine amidotransferase-like domain-containing protein [Candidatus Woesebacteria bacterium]